MKHIALVTFLATSVVVSTTRAEAAPDADHGTTYTDVSSQLTFARNADGFTEGLGGAAWLDYDNDGDLDVYLVNGIGAANGLFRNDGGTFTDVTAAAGVANIGGASAGAVAADIDNDGCTDLFVHGAGGIGGPAEIGQPHVLYVNNCNGTFTDVTADSGITGPHPAMMAAFGDINNDGYLDLFVTNPGSFATGLGAQTLYLNLGNLTFMDISVSAGINSALGGCVVNFLDYDNDGLQDIVLGNCNNLHFPGPPPGIPIPGPWELWGNNGNLTFTDVANQAGLNVHPGFPMALTAGDIDNDGDLDLFATGLGVAFEVNYGFLAQQSLFVNNGDGTYTDGTVVANLAGYEWGWGASFADFDNDGDQDLMHVGSMPPVFNVIGPGLASPGRIYENDGNGNFTATNTFGLEADFVSGLAIGDFDGNGFVDAVIAKAPHTTDPFSGNGAPVLLQNDGNRNHYLTVRLVGTISNRDGVGAIVRAKTGNKIQTQLVTAGTSFASTNSPWLTFGLGKKRQAKIEVTWPSGLTETFPGNPANQTVTLVEGQGKSNPARCPASSRLGFLAGRAEMGRHTVADAAGSGVARHRIRLTTKGGVPLPLHSAYDGIWCKALIQFQQ